MGGSLPGQASAARSPKFTVRGQGERLNVLGDTQHVLLTGEETEGRFSLVESGPNDPGVGPPLHIHHREDETFYVLEGKVKFTVEDESVVCESGSSVFLPRDSVHTWKVVGDKPARMLITLTPSGLEGYFRQLSELGAEGAPDMKKLLQISAEYGIEFPELSAA